MKVGAAGFVSMDSKAAKITRAIGEIKAWNKIIMYVSKKSDP